MLLISKKVLPLHFNYNLKFFKMKQYFLVLTICTVATSISCGQQIPKDADVVIETTYGNIAIKLYDETPLHRDNFIKLAKEGFYDDLIFHRVINEFMIQGGDPDSKGSTPEQPLGSGGPGYQIDAEIVYPKYFHKKGALAAARTNNPERKSSGSQFYIVQGKVYSNEEVEMEEQSMIQRQSQAVVNKYFEPHREAYIRLQTANDAEGMEKMRDMIMNEAAAELEALKSYKLPAEIREAYTTVGGTPRLDDAYTVFGEVIDGLDVIDKIAAVETGAQDRPLKNVVMKIKVVNNR